VFFRFDLQLKNILKILRNNLLVRLLYLPTEPPLITSVHESTILSKLPVDLVLTWNEDSVRLGSHVEKIEIGQPIIEPNSIPSVPFQSKKFCCAIFSRKMRSGTGELYSVRRELIRFFALQNVDFDLFGVGWDEDPDPVIRQVYCGPVDSKIETMKNYRFSLCLENSKIYPGYITEKIFDSFAAGSVPVYLGAPDITDRIPRTTMIDLREYSHYPDLLERMMRMSPVEYEEMLCAARSFIESKAYYDFTSVAFARKVTQSIKTLISKSNTRPRNIFGFKLGILSAIIRGKNLSIKDYLRLRRFFINIFR